jgi:hypothetical protein
MNKMRFAASSIAGRDPRSRLEPPADERDRERIRAAAETLHEIGLLVREEPPRVAARFARRLVFGFTARTVPDRVRQIGSSVRGMGPDAAAVTICEASSPSVLTTPDATAMASHDAQAEPHQRSEKRRDDDE